ncbi:MAG: hypothetical protein FWD64_09815 [Acidobacteriaceae bacterium]|nr:hypothetical protein [Acidobacteriaceae bacterium]
MTEKKAGLSAKLSARAGDWRAWFTKLNFLYAGAGALALVCLYLLIHCVYAWNQSHSSNEDALNEQRAILKRAQIEARHLDGLDGKLADATGQSDDFYQDRLPYAGSQVARELGALAKDQGIKLTRATYMRTPVMVNKAGALTELRIDASLTGDYRPLVLFVNRLERDKQFFLINGVTLTGQQAGMVGLRLRMTTYLRPPQTDEEKEDARKDKDIADNNETAGNGSVAK